MRKVVVIGGGHGSSVVLSSLTNYDIELTAVVSMADDGGSTGRLRADLNVLPPGDIRQCLVALADDQELKDLFNYRFGAGDLKGHSLGNLYLSAGELLTGSIEKSIDLASKALGAKGKVLPVSNENCQLVLRQNGEEIIGEYKIGDTKLKSKSPDIGLSSSAKLSGSANSAINNADMVIIAPGNFYCSIIPALLVDGIKQALASTSAKVVMITNLINNPKHTYKFSVSDMAGEVERFIGKDVIDLVIYNTASIPDQFLRDDEEAVKPIEAQSKANYKMRGVDLVSTESAKADPNDVIAQVRSLVGHNKQKLGEVINEILNRE